MSGLKIVESTVFLGTHVVPFVKKLAVYVFVLYVESPAFAPMLPVFSRGPNDKVELVTRTCCFIVDNMCKFVEYLAAMIPWMCEFEPCECSVRTDALCTYSERNEPPSRGSYSSTLNWHVH